MVRLAIEGNPHFELSLIEMNAEGFTYTYRTLERLKEQNPDTDYYFIIGADSLYNFINMDGTVPDLQGVYDRCCDQRSCTCKEPGSGDDLSFQTIRRMFYTAEYSEY